MPEELADSFYMKQAEPNRSCLLSLRNIILNHNPHLSETRKYGMPCFCYFKKIVCYLWTDKKTNEPYLLLAEGKHLKHPLLETGSRKKMKIMRIQPEEDIPLESIKEILTAAIQLYN